MILGECVKKKYFVLNKLVFFFDAFCPIYSALTPETHFLGGMFHTKVMIFILHFYLRIPYKYIPMDIRIRYDLNDKVTSDKYIYISVQ